MRFSNKQTALILGQSQTKARRWAKEFLPADPEKGLRSGKTRRHSLNEVFTIFLGGYLVDKMGFGISVARAILKDLTPWMGREGLFPQRTSNHDPKDLGKEKVERYEIVIMPTRSPLGFCYELRGLIREQRGTDGIVRGKYVVHHFFGSETDEVTPAVNHARILNISSLLHRFQIMLSCYTH